MLNDVLVLNRIRRGDVKAFEVVFRQYYSSLYYYALSITGMREVAEEVIQDLFYVWWKERQSIQVKFSIKNYLYRAVRNRSLQHIEHRGVRERYRQNKLANESEEQSFTPQQELEKKELQAILNSTLKNLTERRLKIFSMHRFEGQKYKEIAEKLSLSVKTVEAEMSKAYQVLRKEVEKYMNGYD